MSKGYGKFLKLNVISLVNISAFICKSTSSSRTFSSFNTEILLSFSSFHGLGFHYRFQRIWKWKSSCQCSGYFSFQQMLSSFSARAPGLEDQVSSRKYLEIQRYVPAFFFHFFFQSLIAFPFNTSKLLNISSIMVSPYNVSNVSAACARVNPKEIKGCLKI